MRSLLTLTLILCLISAALCADVFYELSGNDACTGLATEGYNLDVLCNIRLPEEGPCSNLSEVRLNWGFASPRSRFIIKDSQEYGIWSEVASEPGSLTSLLRIRKVDQEKHIGMFTCSLVCLSEPQATMASHKLEVCVKDSATGLALCGLATAEESCTLLFSNNNCDELCDSEDQLFDGGDCDSYIDERCTTSGCLTSYNDGSCDKNCSSNQCGFDGGDCLLTAHSITRETLAVVIPTSYNIPIWVNYLSRQISILTATLVQPYREATPWAATASKGIQATYLNPVAFELAENNLTMLRYKLVPQSCLSDRRCFLRVRNAAKYLSHHLLKDAQTINSSIAAIGVISNLDECQQSTERKSPNGEVRDKNGHSKSGGQTTPMLGLEIGIEKNIGIGLCTVALVVLIIGIIIACRYRRIAQSKGKSQTTQKQSNVREYIENIPMDFSSEGSSTSSNSSTRSGSHKSPHSSISRSASFKDTKFTRTTSNSHDYRADDDSGINA